MSSRLAPLLADVRQWPVRYAKGQLIYDEGDLSDCLYLVAEGCVRLQVVGEDGSRQIVRFLVPGDVFGLCTQRRNTAAEAVTAVSLIRYELSSLFGKPSVQSTVARELIDDATSAYQQLAHHIAVTVKFTAFRRVKSFYNWVRSHNVENGNSPASIPMSQRDIADYLGIAPETLSRCLKRLNRQGRRKSESRDSANG